MIIVYVEVYWLDVSSALPAGGRGRVAASASV